MIADVVVIGFVAIGVVVFICSIVGAVLLSPLLLRLDVVNITGTVTVVAKMRANTPPPITLDLLKFLPISD